MNYVKTTILLAALTMLLVWIGGMVGGQHGAMIAFTFAIVLNFVSFWFSDKIVLRMYKAQEVSQSQAPELYEMVWELTRRAKLPTPKLYIIPQEVPNAFATGRNPKHACVAVTRGLLDNLTKDEIKGVVAHELAHIKNRDTLIMTIAASIAGAVMMLAHMARWAAIFGVGGRRRDGGNAITLLAIAIVAPLAAMVIQLAISRSREYVADSRGAVFAGSSSGLANALQKLESFSKNRRANVAPQTAHMFIVNPLHGGGIASLFSTHPPIAERVKRLQAMKA